MLTFIIVWYSIVALIGIYLLVKLLIKKPSKLVVGIIHGLLGLFGISFLIIYTSFKQGATPVTTILLFVLAFFIGGGMFVMNAQKKNYPRIVTFIHAAVAATGIYFLIRFWLG